MMAQKHLHELLKEDQEPFLLKNYIADRCGQLKRPSPKTHLQVKKRKPITEASNFPGYFCKNACFFSFHDSPDLRKSPLFEFSSPAKSPCKGGSNAIFLHIPARTAALLLEASLRIQKQSTTSSKPKTHNNNNNGFGLFGSLLKRLTHRNRNRKREIEGDGVKISVKDILRWDSSVGHRKLSSEKQRMEEKKVAGVEDQSVSEISGNEIGIVSCPCTGRPSSAVWSESNEEKSLDLETSSSGLSDDSEEIEFLSRLREGGGDDDKGFCQSPFRFVLQRSPSTSGRRTPEFSSPVTSPSRHKTEDKENYDTESLKKLQAEEEEEDKEQCSPVSVLDPPFEDDDVGHDDGDEDGFDMDCSYAIVQRTKQQLLHKLRRFEKLAELDPIELEKRMLEEDDNDDNYDINDREGEEEEEECEDYVSRTSDREENVYGFVRQVLCKSSFSSMKQIPKDMKRLVSDLIVEEQKQHNAIDNEGEVVERVCERLESWKEVESNTIDMMVEQDFRRELEGWKKNQEQLGETAMDIELSIFGLLVEELAAELVFLNGI
ncbi:uncharacterized protein LOC107434963 [Ziziphus jujuba]|uniref:Uncharacterized protein LOC107434963 n=1 Tax=Ziziphus jujuba TaxID=326968 RepID=A0A6P4BG86_ZIZJJ|nr:uncharacterized protein LOC107434963 [Ziziphus jujuba]